ncbi:putative ATPase [Novosphingobium kunmingense]|uniref:Putative ATPase n=1 Tax=Novosphingobium kunmingense TaxID=1211806 RepID=A0A2N0H521_9SPHN|nr:AAA family ATPase [Novosphingobium kunmingense]PKB14014.1 putative ATPase [Novosphingobium kunmingense]
MPGPRHAVLTGAPGAGKTTLLDAAAAAGLATSPEVARRILQRPGGMALREQDPLAFAEAMAEAHAREYERYAGRPGPVLFDRGFPDVVGFLDVSGLSVPRSVDRICRDLRYDGPILRAPAWADIYVQDAERIQDWQGAVASDEAVTAAWRRYGYRVTPLPLMPVEQRLAFVLERLHPAA